MEIKKSNKANIDNKRSTGFLLGLIVALSFTFVALEMNFGMPDKQDTDDHLLDELLKNVDQAPAADKVEKVRAVKIPKKIDFDAVPKKTPPTVAPNPTLDKVVVSDMSIPTMNVQLTRKRNRKRKSIRRLTRFLWSSSIKVNGLFLTLRYHRGDGLTLLCGWTRTCNIRGRRDRRKSKVTS